MTPKALDLTGQRFGLLVAEEFVGKNADGRRLWRCQCDCGKSSVVPTHHLRSGATRSCGCRSMTSNTTHGMSGTPLYRRWAAMIARTTNPNTPNWADYGGRGITVCGRWREFTNFDEDMGATFALELELDRIDNERGYEKDNCRWATRSNQQRNRRNNHRLNVNGLDLTIVEWSERLGIKSDKIRRRLSRDGWSDERALEPGDGRRKKVNG